MFLTWQRWLRQERKGGWQPQWQQHKFGSKKQMLFFKNQLYIPKKKCFPKIDSVFEKKKQIRWIPRHCHSHCQSPFHVVARTDFARVIPRISVVLQAFCEISLELGIKDWDWQKIFFFWFTWRDFSLFQFSLMFGKENVVIKSESWWNLTSMFAFSHWNTCKQSKNAMVFDIDHQSSNDTIQLTRKYWRWGYEILFVLDCDDKEKHSVEAWQCIVEISMRFWQRLNFNSNHPILFPKPELPFQNFQKKTLDKWYEWFGISQLQCKKTHEQFHKRKGSAYFFSFQCERMVLHSCLSNFAQGELLFTTANITIFWKTLLIYWKGYSLLWNDERISNKGWLEEGSKMEHLPKKTDNNGLDVGRMQFQLKRTLKTMSISNIFCENAHWFIFTRKRWFIVFLGKILDDLHWAYQLLTIAVLEIKCCCVHHFMPLDEKGSCGGHSNDIWNKVWCEKRTYWQFCSDFFEWNKDIPNSFEEDSPGFGRGVQKIISTNAVNQTAFLFSSCSSFLSLLFASSFRGCL